MSKRKRIVLSLADKANIIQKLKQGSSGATLAKEYGVGTSTISDIKKNSESILKYVTGLENGQVSSQRKTMKTAADTDLDSAVYTWFVEKRSQGHPFSGPLLCEKALQLNEKLQGSTDFKATTGWLKRFKCRYGITQLEVHGESLSADSEAANLFKEKLKLIIEDGDYDFNSVYNADETGLYWKALPSKSLASRHEEIAPGFKSSKQRITVMLCTNVTGSHKLPLLIIGKAKKPRCFKGVVTLPVIYKSHKHSWMDMKIFTEWYDEVFVPQVKIQQQKSGQFGKVLLIIDSAPSHPCAASLEREDGMFKVIFLPPNVTSILQPLDQGVIENLKCLYRNQLLRRLLLGENDELFMNIFKKTDLKEVIYMAADAWDTVSDIIIKNCWKNLLQENTEKDNNNHTDCQITEPIVEIIQDCPQFKNCDANDVSDWLHCDEDDPGFQIVSDEEIAIKVEKAESEDEEGELSDNDEDHSPSHDEAFNCFDNGMKWLEQQKECDTATLLILKRLRDLAARKRVASRQKSLNRYCNHSMLEVRNLINHFSSLSSLHLTDFFDVTTVSVFSFETI